MAPLLFMPQLSVSFMSLIKNLLLSFVVSLKYLSAVKETNKNEKRENMLHFILFLLKLSH